MNTASSYVSRASTAVLGCLLVLCAHAWLDFSWRTVVLAALVIWVVSWTAGGLPAAMVAVLSAALTGKAVVHAWDKFLDWQFVAAGAGLLYLIVGWAAAAIEVSTRPGVTRADDGPSRSAERARDDAPSARE